MSDPHYFEWQVPKPGYQWIETRARNLGTGRMMAKGQYLSRRITTRDRVLRYRPLQEYSGLFETFAKTEPTPDDIRAFANTYGLLGGDAQVVIEGKRLIDQPGEPLVAWQGSIKAMRGVVDLWRLTKDETAEARRKLRELIHWKNNICAYSTPGLEGNEWGFQYTRLDDAVVEQLPRNDFRTAGRWLLQRLINMRLHGRVSARLMWDGDDFGLFQVPDCLLSAMWLQLAAAIARDKHYQQCPQCGAFFEIAPGAARKGKRFCSDRCRMAAYRERKAEEGQA